MKFTNIPSTRLRYGNGVFEGVFLTLVVVALCSAVVLYEKGYVRVSLYVAAGFALALAAPTQVFLAMG